MIKKGDKVVCITDDVVEVKFAPVINSKNYFFKKGDFIEISGFYAEYVQFTFNGHEKLYLLYFIAIENFITLAEWRERQIDSILEDD